MRRLLDLFGVLVLVLLLSAFDERGAEQTATRVRAELTDIWSRVSSPATSAPTLPTRAADHALRGPFAASDSTPWPLLHADGAQLEITGLGTLQTRPYRIATASEPPLAAMNLSPGQQVELREITGLTPSAGSLPLCPEYPARYLALAAEDGTLHLLAFADRPEGDARPCAALAFRIP